ncbi:MAG: hypothetical protein QCI38_07760, partial [Candidatus Thermoplasmatota archaeon]|nr:hypothetical protein [Candidatus Thermoplasmatota archaeon]
MELKKVFALALVVVVVVASASLFLLRWMDDNDGQGPETPVELGTPDNPFLIRNVFDLQNMSKNLTAHYALANDIDASETVGWNNGAGFVPVGNRTGNYRAGDEMFYPNAFTGSLDGRNHTITGLHINRPSTDNVGLFGYVGDEGVVKNVGLDDITVIGNEGVGGLIGTNRGSVYDSYTAGNVNGTRDVGGSMGRNSGMVTNSYTTGTTTGNHTVGGLIGANFGLVCNAYAAGNVTGYSHVG